MIKATLTTAMPRNLAQIRGKNAFEATRNASFSGENSGEVVKKIPALIVECGLLATLAYAIAKKGDWEKAFLVILHHLKDDAIQDATAKDIDENLKAWFEHLVSVSAEELRQATAETLAFLEFFRRFAKKEG